MGYLYGAVWVSVASSLLSSSFDSVCSVVLGVLVEFWVSSGFLVSSGTAGCSWGFSAEAGSLSFYSFLSS